MRTQTITIVFDKTTLNVRLDLLDGTCRAWYSHEEDGEFLPFIDSGRKSDDPYKLLAECRFALSAKLGSIITSRSDTHDLLSESQLRSALGVLHQPI